jgi:hypothetical protein
MVKVADKPQGVAYFGLPIFLVVIRAISVGLLGTKRGG